MTHLLHVYPGRDAPKLAFSQVIDGPIRAILLYP
jgi:hypothetical protein